MGTENRNLPPGEKRPSGGNHPRNQRTNGGNSGGSGNGGNGGGSFLGRSWFWLVLAVLVLFGSRFFFGRPTDTSNMIGLNEVARYVANGQVDRVVVQGDIITLELDNSEEWRSRKEGDESLLETLKALGVSE